MPAFSFESAFEAITGNAPFPWQRALYDRFVNGAFPSSCNLPTGLGKTSVIPIWLLALATAPTGTVPRRLVYVVNRRTVVDQSTREAEKVRANLWKVPLVEQRLVEMCAALPTPVAPFKAEPPLAISTLRGQFADNREWSADPARPAVVVGTVDMIGSRLLFNGYGVGFKGKPLHAGFLGQDVLLVHDEAHLEPAFQELLTAIRNEQERCKEFGTFRVLELSATLRSGCEVFELTMEEKDPPGQIPNPPKQPIHHVWRRQTAKKAIHLHENKDEKNLADEIAKLALEHNDSSRAVLIFVRKVEDVEKVVKKLPRGSFEKLTGTLRGKERDELVDKPIFRRFLAEGEPGEKTVYLVCTSAGEVGVNISADHLVCDLTTFDSMAQRFGRVNRFGDRDDTRIDIVYPKEFDEKDDYESRLMKTLELLHQLNSVGSPAALGKLDASGRLAAYAPPPTILPVSDILFDAWALTTIRGKLPGRPMVEPYLHGVSGWEPPETHVAWREEVGVITGDLLDQFEPEDLLEDYPLKPHELLRDNSNRVFDRLKKLAASAATPVWVVSYEDTVKVTTLGELINAGKDALSYKTVLLPPSAGGLEKGMLTSDWETADDVADDWWNDRKAQRRSRQVWDDDGAPSGMRLVRTIDTKPDEDEEESNIAGRRYWHWYELPNAGDSEGSKSNKKRVLWQVHTDDVTRNAQQIVDHLPLSDELKRAVILAAEWHDLGKRRQLFQRILGNWDSNILLAKSGNKQQSMGLQEDFRHEFGSLIDVLDEKQPYFAEFQKLTADMKDLVLHLIAVHHGRGRPHFSPDEAFDPEPKGRNVAQTASEVPQRFARLQRKYGRWGLAYVESLLRAADYAASANPSAFVEDES